MKFLLLLAGLLLVGFALSVSATSAIQSAPTLVPPTLVPTVDTGQADALPSESAVARIQREGHVRVGILYNAPPFGELNIRGEVTGFDADLGRALAEAWGVEIEFIQVTRQTALEMLRRGDVDMLLAAQVHRRELDALVEFSQTYYRGSQSMLLRNDDPAASLSDMANRRVGVVMGASAENAVAVWQTRASLSVTMQPYLNLDQALVALVSNEVDGVVDSEARLQRIAADHPGVVRVLDEPVVPEPYAIALRRQDVNMRNLVNRTLQYLHQTQRLQPLYATYFPSKSYPFDLVTVWAGLGEEAPQPGQFPGDLQYPAQYVIPQMQAGQVIRVAGLNTLPADATESQKRVDALNRALVELLAARLGVRVEYLPDSAANALDLVASGQADLAVGVEPNWASVDRVDYTSPYLLHGQRLMVKTNSDFESFIDLRGGKWVAIVDSEPEMRDRAVELADSVNARIEIYISREEDVAFSILTEQNADVAFGDSLKLIPHVQANPDVLRLAVRGERVDPWYSRSYMAFAVPRNDIDFRLLVEYTLQELALEGQLQPLLQPVMLPEDIPAFEFWPGPSEYLGFSLASPGG